MLCLPLTRAGSDTLYAGSPWFAGADVDAFPGPTRPQRLAQMAAHFGLDILSPIATARDSPVQEPREAGYTGFTTEEMVREAHRAGVLVKPWTVNRLGVAERLVEWGVDGMISDCA